MNEKELRDLAAMMPMNGDLVFGTVMGLYGVLMLYLQQLPRADLDRFLERFQREIDHFEFEVEGVPPERRETIDEGVRLGLECARKALIASTTGPGDAASDGNTARVGQLRFRMDAAATVPLPRHGSLLQRALGILTRLSGEGVSAAFATVCLLLYLSPTVPLVPDVPNAQWFLIGFFAFAGLAAIKTVVIQMVAAVRSRETPEQNRS